MWVRNPPPAQKRHCGIEQWLAHESHNLKVGGSNPPPATKMGIMESSVPYCNSVRETEFESRMSTNKPVLHSGQLHSICNREFNAGLKHITGSNKLTSLEGATKGVSIRASGLLGCGRLPVTQNIRWVRFP